MRDLKSQKFRQDRENQQLTEEHTFIPKINHHSSVIADSVGRSSKKESPVYYITSSGEMIVDPISQMNLKSSKTVYQRLTEKAELRDIRLEKKVAKQLTKEISSNSFKPHVNPVSSKIDMQARLEYQIFEPRYEQLHNLHKAHTKKKQLLQEKLDSKFKFKPEVNKGYTNFSQHKFNPDFDFLTRMELDAQERAEKEAILRQSLDVSKTEERSKSPFEKETVRTLTNISTKKLYNDAFLLEEKIKRRQARQEFRLKKQTNSTYVDETSQKIIEEKEERLIHDLFE